MGKKPSSKPPGPEAQRLKIPGDWEKAVGKALKKQPPKEGWPESAKEVKSTKQK